MGFKVIVALESDRIPLAAFKDGVEASAYCDAKNGALPDTPGGIPRTLNVDAGNGLSLAQKVAAAQGK